MGRGSGKAKIDRAVEAAAAGLAPVMVPDEVRELVRRFEEHREDLRDPSYVETRLRQDFLDPFFLALGWDVINRAGYAEAYRDVILEHSLRVEKSVKAPDYCFRIGGTPKFFVEAKKPDQRKQLICQGVLRPVFSHQVHRIVDRSLPFCGCRALPDPMSALQVNLQDRYGRQALLTGGA